MDKVSKKQKAESKTITKPSILGWTQTPISFLLRQEHSLCTSGYSGTHYVDQVGTCHHPWPDKFLGVNIIKDIQDPNSKGFQLFLNFKRGNSGLSRCHRQLWCLPSIHRPPTSPALEKPDVVVYACHPDIREVEAGAKVMFGYTLSLRPTWDTASRR